jgi:alpha-galactosidase
MKKVFTLVLCSIQFIVFSQSINLATAKFTTDNNDAFKETNFDDSQWKEIKTGLNYELQGYDGYNGYSWYRIKAIIPTSIKEKSFWKDSLCIDLGRIDDCDEVFLNGILINKSGQFPSEEGGYITTWNAPQQIYVATTNPIIKWDEENVIAIKVYDGNGGGGLFGNEAFINMVDLIGGIKISTVFINSTTLKVIVKNKFNLPINGEIEISGKHPDESNLEDGYNFTETHANLRIEKNKEVEVIHEVKPDFRSREVRINFKEANSERITELLVNTPYILTPNPSQKPTINTPTEFGVGTNHPFIYKIPATGLLPLIYSVSNLPKGLKIDATTGVITGEINKAGVYKTIVSVKNSKGVDSKSFVIKVGKGIALTPPMGWNSWNCWGTSVSQDKVISSAQAMIDKGLINYGWSFVNIDDGWEAKERNANGEIATNDKFPKMKGLGDFLHKEGLKFGIYSSPGPLTCGGYLGSHQHELQDAQTYANWGVDYLKYDWCSYDNIHVKTDTTLLSFKKPFIVMNDALKKQNRDIVYSLCQYGMKDVWKWGASVGGNVWRTTGDIEDSWESLKGIGFNQIKQQAYAKPGGGWNDADMMIVGNVGWGENLHPTRLTPDEQYTHVSLWCLLNNPLLIGCDMNTLDDFTLSLLSNNEVIAIDQNTFSAPAKPIIKNNDYEVWVKQMSVKTFAVGIFNMQNETQVIRLDWRKIGLTNVVGVRNVWRQENELMQKKFYNTAIDAHGVKLILCSIK